MNPPPRPNLKAQILSDLDTDKATTIEVKYIKRIWGSMSSMSSWCASWNLIYEFFQERGVVRVNGPSQWLKITRAELPTELDLNPEDDEERITINETDACL